jgi:5-methylthioadenosine/S-adenosylhomocysteine deaminase
LGNEFRAFPGVREHGQIMQEVDTLIEPRWIIPVVPTGVELERHAVAITDGRIVAVLPTDQAHLRYAPRRTITLPSHALIPGLVNAHTHAAMSLMRGMADDLPLMTWLSEHIWPAEARVVNEQYVHDGTRLAVAEMLLGGTTCFNDMYFFPNHAGKAAIEMGIRAVLGMIVIDFPTAWAKDPDEYIERGIALHDEMRHQPLVTTAWAPHAPYTVSDEPLLRIRTLAHEMDVPIHIHVHETATEVEDALKATGRRPINRLAELELFTPRLLAVHMTQLNDSEIELAGHCGISVAHCPESNLKLASGFAPVQALRDAGVNVCLGTDGAASNNDLDMLGEMRTMAMLAKAVAKDASALPAADALEVATVGGARALGLGAETGSIEVGKAADLVAIDLDHPSTQPVYSPTSAVVYAASRNQVSSVWVNGEQRVHNGALINVDLQRLLANAATWQTEVSAR